jgi:hypothetical protein
MAGLSATLTTNTFANSGYTFIGWGTASEATSSSYPYRVSRGGSWISVAELLQVGYRYEINNPYGESSNGGFRVCTSE